MVFVTLYVILLGKLFYRLLTWKPAGAVGEHSTTQSLSDKQLVNKIIINICM